MILPRLQRHSRTFQRKPLRQLLEVDQQLSIQEMNLQGLVLHQRSLHHHQGQRLHTFHPPAATPMTPGRTGSTGSAQQVRHKAFPHDQQVASTMSMASPSAIDMSRMSDPSPKGPPASFMPTPGDVQHMSSCAAAVDPGNRSERGRIYRVRSVTDIDWNHLLEEQLEPNLKGVRSTPKTTSFELCRRLMVYTTFDQF